MAISKNIKFKNTYTLESLYEAIKDQSFTAGQPILAKHLGVTMIVFPPIDSHNQVQIIKGSLFKKETDKYMVQKGEAIGLDNMVKNIALDLITDDWASARSVIGNSAEESFQMVDVTAAELEQLGL